MDAKLHLGAVIGKARRDASGCAWSMDPVTAYNRALMTHYFGITELMQVHLPSVTMEIVAPALRSGSLTPPFTRKDDYRTQK